MADMTQLRAVQIAPGAWTDGVQSAEFKKLIDAKRRSMVAGNYVRSWALATVYARISANRHDPLVKMLIDKARVGGSAQ
jgi:hypothetical protein